MSARLGGCGGNGVHNEGTKLTETNEGFLYFLLMPSVRLRFLRFFVVNFVLFAIFVSAGLARTQPSPHPSRIISLIPAVTEMLFAVGAGPQVVAVSSFDRYPPEVTKLQRVGALLDPDVERILSLRPDLVVVYASQSDLRTQLERAGVPTYVYSHAGLADVWTTLQRIGERVGHRPEADDLMRRIQGRIDSVRQRVTGHERPRTLIVFDRESLALRGIYASGGIGFIHDIVNAAGGDNVFSDVRQAAVQATTELILAKRPDAILELRGEPMPPAIRAKEIAVWRSLTSVPAIRTNRVYVIDQQMTVVPGPRVGDAVELIAKTLHPDLFK
jgi:cobalamin transport system substrate-binding protein